VQGCALVDTQGQALIDSQLQPVASPLRTRLEGPSSASTGGHGLAAREFDGSETSDGLQRPHWASRFWVPEGNQWADSVLQSW
jgi:hypothetical protein